MRRFLTCYQEDVAETAFAVLGDRRFNTNELTRAWGKQIPGGVIGALKRSKVLIEIDGRYPATYQFHPDYIKSKTDNGGKKR